MVSQNKMTVPFFRHSLNASYAKGVADVLEQGFITSGNIGKEVEAKIATYFDIDHALLTNSWTNGAIATLLAMGIGPGDEVLVPAMTFIATANVVELVGATPVFVDVDEKTLMPSVSAYAEHITSRTKAILVVHLYGQMCDVRALRESIDPNIRIIEDCAHCFEGEKNGEKPGVHSDAAVFSFYATKNITCGEGGCVITHDTELAGLLEKTRLHGMSAGAKDRYKGGVYVPWDMDILGTKANLPDLLAVLLPEQIDRVDTQLILREKIAGRYQKVVDEFGIRTQQDAPNIKHARHLFPIWVEPHKRGSFIKYLNEEGVGVTVNYPAVTDTTYYAKKYGLQVNDYPVATEWGRGTLSLPLYPLLNDKAVEYVAAKLGEFAGI